MMEIKGARTQHLWGDKYSALFCTEKLTENQAAELLLSRDNKIIELLYVGDGPGWKSLLRQEAEINRRT